MKKRISRAQLYIKIAELFSQRATCQRLQVGCVIVNKGRIISTGYNGPPAGGKHCNDGDCQIDKPCLSAIHAEANAIAFAAQQGIRLKRSTIYCTHSPCIKCAELIIQSGIKEVVFHTLFRDNLGILFLNKYGVITTKYA